MQTHNDNSHIEWFKELKRRAKEGERGKTSQITAGRDGETELARWSHGGMQVVHRPPDPQGILRCSVGGGDTPVPLNYCTIRGSVGECIKLLEMAIEALKRSPE